MFWLKQNQGLNAKFELRQTVQCETARTECFKSLILFLLFLPRFNRLYYISTLN